MIETHGLDQSKHNITESSGSDNGEPSIEISHQDSLRAVQGLHGSFERIRKGGMDPRPFEAKENNNRLHVSPTWAWFTLATVSWSLLQSLCDRDPRKLQLSDTVTSNRTTSSAEDHAKVRRTEIVVKSTIQRIEHRLELLPQISLSSSSSSWCAVFCPRRAVLIPRRVLP